MGRPFRLASPENVAVTGWVAIAPMISRTPVPELPQSITSAGSAKPPTPTPRTDQLPPPLFATSAPNARIALAVSNTSCPSSSPAIVVSPTHIAPRISARCEIDLSPGTSAVPRKGPQAVDVIGIGSPWPDMLLPSNYTRLRSIPPTHAGPCMPISFDHKYHGEL